MHNFQQLL